MMKLKTLITRFDQSAKIIAAAIVLTAALMNLEFNFLEAHLYDFRISHASQTKPDKNIVLITIDDRTAQALNEPAPLSLDFHARILEALETYNPKAIGYLVDMNRVKQASPDAFKGEAGSRFVSAANRLQSTGIPLLLGTPFDVSGEQLPPPPLSVLPHAVALIHKDGNVFAEDKVTRRALAYLYDAPSFHVALAQRLGLVAQGKLPRGTFDVPEAEAKYFFFQYHGSGGDDRAYARISASDVLNHSVSAGRLAGKILLVGTLTRGDTSDYAITPYLKTALTNSKIGVHADILDAVIHNDGIARAPAWFNWATTFAVIVFVFWWVLTSTPLYGVFATIGLAAAFAVIGQLLFSIQGLWIRESQPLVGIFFGYYLAVPYRLIQEYKKRWDYQRKNEILTQVEELKTNFLSLVTHDLKTPVARIQGLAEMLMKKAAGRMADQDRDTLRHIIGASDELNRFITSILELNRVESKGLHLTFESKDVNLLIERAVEGFRAQALAAKIRMTTDLEPLFPIRVDVSLIGKVINNLIDNALKYSPAGSEIRIETRETGDWVEISVTDQGIGMSEQERTNLFTRFYRAKNETTTKVAGTGLGLYLTKYFIEAHRGHVDVVSSLGGGSTFTIKLPIASPDSAKKSTETHAKKENAHVQSISG